MDKSLRKKFLITCIFVSTFQMEKRMSELNQTEVETKLENDKLMKVCKICEGGGDCVKQNIRKLSICKSKKKCVTN